MAVRVHRRFERPTVTLATCEETDPAVPEECHQYCHHSAAE